MHYNVKEICENYNFEISGVSFIGTPKDESMLFVTNKVKNMISNLIGHRNCLVFVETGIEVPDNLKEDNCILVVDDPQSEYAKLALKIEKLEKENSKNKKYKYTHEGYYIGENVIIGEGTIIECGCIIDHNVIIGKNSYIKAGTVIKNAIIGDNFECFERVVIGTDSFFIAKNDGEEMRIPSFGRVIIGKNVSVGAGTVIERGFNGDTQLRDNVKMDGNISIGHDDIICEHVKITAGATLAGFVEVRKNSYIGMNATIKQRVIVEEEAMVGMGAAVIKNVKKGTTVFGNPMKQFNLLT